MKDYVDGRTFMSALGGRLVELCVSDIGLWRCCVGVFTGGSRVTWCPSVLLISGLLLRLVVAVAAG